MSYEAWRITFQNSEEAAKAAYEEAQRWERMFTMAINSVVELTEAAGIRKEDQLTGGTVQALAAIEKLKQRRDKWKARALAAEQWNREMVAKAASNHLEGYRELGRRAATAEAARDELANHVTCLREDVANLLRLVAKIRAAAGNMVSGPSSTAYDDQFQAQPVGIKPETMPSQGASDECTLTGGGNATD